MKVKLRYEGTIANKFVCNIQTLPISRCQVVGILKAIYKKFTCLQFTTGYSCFE